MNETKRYYDDFAGWYERERHHGYHAMVDDLELETVIDLARNATVLEVGCGTGLIMQGLTGVARKLIGVDLSSGMLSAAKGRGFDVTQGDATRLPFADNSFDLVFSFKVLAHVFDITTALSEMSRILRPGGHLIAEFYNSISLRRLAKRIGSPGRISEGRTEAEVYTRWDTPSAIQSYLPGDVTFERWQGIRVITPSAAAFKIWGMQRLLPRMERLAMRSPVSRFGGFLVAVCRKN